MTEYVKLTRLGQIRRLRQMAERVLALYSIQPLSISLLAKVFNTTFTVIGLDGTRDVLNILRPIEDRLSDLQIRARGESELWWLDRVRADLGISVPAPVRTPGGEGTRFAKVRERVTVLERMLVTRG